VCFSLSSRLPFIGISEDKKYERVIHELRGYMNVVGISRGNINVIRIPKGGNQGAYSLYFMLKILFCCI
jgi:hypothetical protein